MIWPNPLTNRFLGVQIHPSFCDGSRIPGKDSIGREAADLAEASHSVNNNKGQSRETMMTKSRIMRTQLIGNAISAGSVNCLVNS